ncbi:MAG: transporter [Chitinophagaceae bacterium]|nr:transporter [Chitinophagaceae bacterium]
MIRGCFFTTLLLLLCSSSLLAQLETEDALPLLPGQVELGAGLEYQTSKEGREVALPVSLEYGLSKKFTLLIEPVGFTTIHPKTGRHVTGIGDLEMTLFYQLKSESATFPAISVSAEIKLPTARDSLIGTGKTDFTPFVIASKTTGKFFTSVNASYTFLGKPAGISVNNLFNYAVGTIFQASDKSIFFAEVYGNTSALGGKDVPENTVTLPSNPSKTSEISGGEKVISAGYGYYVTKNLQLSLSISYDNNHAVLFRPGIIWTSQEGRNFFRHAPAAR